MRYAILIIFVAAAGCDASRPREPAPPAPPAKQLTLLTYNVLVTHWESMIRWPASISP